jgi:cell division protease FtsH
VREKPLEEGVNPVTLARLTAGFTGADISHLVNEAALLAAREEKQTIGMAEFETVLAQVAAG